MKKKTINTSAEESGKGNWKDFLQLLKAINLPWAWIIVSFLCNTLYTEVMLHLPTTTAGLLSGSTDKSVLSLSKNSISSG